MPVINTNYLSLVAQNNLTKSQNTLGSAIEKLSSGLRINSAKDDAAGQAIANRFTANVKGLTQAARNANDGISIAQTTEGALNEINNNLQRVRELTVQAQNGSNSATDLQSIQDEISQRLGEIDRVSQQTQFNGTNVLASDQNMKIQVGAKDGETITIALQKTDSASLGLTSFSVSGVSGPLTEITATDATAGTTTKTKLDVSAIDTQFGTVNAGKCSVHGVGEADAESGEYDDYIVRMNDGRQFQAEVTAAGVVTLTDTSVTDATLADRSATEYSPDAAASTSPLAKLDKALAQVDSFRSQLGAVQNRFQSTITNLNNTVNNLSAARSRIEDADYATEVSNMSKAQILQQAGTSVLAQANQVPQSVLSLLQ